MEETEPIKMPLVAWVSDANLYVDGDRCEDHPYQKSRRNRVAYYPVGTKVQSIEHTMSEHDTAYVGTQCGSPTYTFRDECEKHMFIVAPCQAWGIETRQPADIAASLELLYQATLAEQWTWAKSVSSVAGRVARDEMTELRQLPPRWRNLAHTAVHQGPTVCLRGGAASAAMYDRKQAFLRALFEPLPVRDSWTALPPSTPWKYLRVRDGLIRATVYLRPEAWRGRLPPLPVRTAGLTLYPSGYVRGVWTLPMLRDVIEAGDGELKQAHEIAVCRLEPIHAWAGERIARINDAKLKKLIYTRYWGRLAAIGGWTGTVLPPKDCPRGMLHKFIGSDLYWRWTGYKPDSWDCSPDYRPDHAAYIASSNHRRMNEVTRTVPRDQLIATHVDAVWTDAEEWKPDGVDFKLKATGETRFYGVGTYRCADRMGAQGYDGPLTRETLEAHGRTVRNPNIGRQWIFDESPATSMSAISDPPQWDEKALPGVPDRTIYADLWTPKGWIKKDPAQDAGIAKEDPE